MSISIPTPTSPSYSRRSSFLFTMDATKEVADTARAFVKDGSQVRQTSFHLGRRRVADLAPSLSS